MNDGVLLLGTASASWWAWRIVLCAPMFALMMAAASTARQ